MVAIVFIVFIVFIHHAMAIGAEKVRLGTLGQSPQ